MSGMSRLRAALATALLAATVLAATASEATETRSCAWALKVDPAGVNVLFPDEAAHYWQLSLPVTTGAEVVLRGRYPHSRYLSFTSYDPALRSADGLADARISPDRGSTNPFVAGADRTAARRDYTVRVVVGDRPARPALNTLYTGSADGSRSNRFVNVIYRNYRQDRGLGDDGGVGLPRVFLSVAGNEVEVPPCDHPTVPPNDVNQVLAQAAPPAAYPTGFGQVEPVVWKKFYNLPTSAGHFLTTPLTGTAVGDALSPVTTSTAPGGFADNPDNRYITTVVSSGLGDVAVIQARMPRTPATFQGQPRMGSGELRYWSMCSEEFFSGRFYACLVDDQVPLRRDRSFTIMVSTPEHRPANARPACGIAWLPMGAAPDTVLIERNMLADPGFRHSIQRARYGHELQDLGRYYPRTRYLSTSRAEALGCKGIR